MLPPAPARLHTPSATTVLRKQSPYALQYLQFERRLEGGPRRSRLPALTNRRPTQGVAAMGGD